MITRGGQSPERFDAKDTSKGLIASEHYARYLWAAQLAKDRTVLDAGCGTGYGTKILADVGASKVVGVDISSASVKGAAETYAHPQIEWLEADLASLPFRDNEFDLIVCYEVIEHAHARDQILDELARVLNDDGVLCISTPNRKVYPPGNPFHLYEYESEGFAETLNERFSHVVLYRQNVWLTSTILSDGELTGTEGRDLNARAVKLVDKLPGDETYMVALAAKHELPRSRSILALGDSFEVRWWQEQIDASDTRAEASVNEARRQLHQANEAASEARNRSKQSAEMVLEVEELIAQINARNHALEDELEIRTNQIEVLSQRIERADRVLDAMRKSISWRLTAPLRALKGSR
jgi:O-antigen biosynthesis protein